MFEIPEDIKQAVNDIKATSNTWSESDPAYAANKHLTEECKYKFLGCGSYSSVYSHVKYPGKVFKITYNSKDGYHQYVEWIAENEKRIRTSIRRHLPKIYATHIAKGGVRVTVLEKLSQRSHYNNNHTELTNAHTYGVACSLLNNLSDAFQGLCNDQGGDNVMIRRGRSAVITDPWSRRSYS